LYRSGGIAFIFEAFGPTAPKDVGGPLTVMSAMYCSSFVALLSDFSFERRLGLSAIKDVSTVPSVKSGCSRTFSRKDLFVVTPRTRNSFKARRSFLTQSALFVAVAVTLTKSES
jgi:hypothetical protein